MKTTTRSALLRLALFVAVVSACDDDDPFEVEVLSVAGEWAGTASLPNPTGASMSLQQSGAGVTGLIRVSSAFPQGLAATGTVSESNRLFTWVVGRGCEVWGGALSVSADGRQMSGSVLINRSGCQPAQSNTTGSMTFTRQ